MNNDKADRVAALLGVSLDRVRDVLKITPPAPDIKNITTVQQAKETYSNTPYGSGVKRFAFEKWISLCTTIAQIKGAYDNASDGSEVERLAIQKVAELL